MSMLSVLLIEFQGFRDDARQFLIKELTLSDIKSKTIERCVFKPPYSIDTLSKKTQIANAWCTRNIHDLRWESGKMEYCQLENILKTKAYLYKYVMTKGLEKKVFLEKILNRQVFNMDDFICVSYKSLKDNSVTCDHEKMCAAKNIKKLRDLLKKLLQETSMEDLFSKST